MIMEQRKESAAVTEFSELNALREFVLNESGVYDFTYNSGKG
jgi:hypothetical protein